MTTQQKREKNIAKGKGWCKNCLVSIDTFKHTFKGHDKLLVGVYIGDEYYETDPYSRKDYALCEAKGWLEGVKAQIEGVLDAINKEIEDFKED